jgi:hypothetical protein
LIQAGDSSFNTSLVNLNILRGYSLTSLTSYFYRLDGDIDYTMTTRFSRLSTVPAETVRTEYAKVRGQEKIVRTIENDGVTHTFTEALYSETVNFDWGQDFIFTVRGKNNQDMIFKCHINAAGGCDVTDPITGAAITTFADGSIFTAFSEDKNGNGVLDPSEDTPTSGGY